MSNDQHPGGYPPPHPVPPPVPEGAGFPPPYPGAAPQPGPAQPDPSHGGPAAYSGAAQPGATGHPGAAAYPGSPQPYPGDAQQGGPSRPGGGRNRVLMWSLIGGGALVLVVAAIVGFTLLQQQSVAQSAEQKAAAMSAPVEGYLQALADGDAEAALGFLSDPESSPLLTDEVLAVSNELAPIGGIEVGSVDPEALEEAGLPEIPASYTIGDATVDVTFSVSDGGKEGGDFRIIGGLGTVSMPSDYAAIGPTVNGVAVEADMAAAFPGTYQLLVDDERYEVAEGGVTTVTAPYESGSFWEARIALSEDTAASLRQLVTDEVNACVASKQLDPGCGLALDPQINGGSVTLKDGTVTRTLTGDAKTTLSRLEIELDWSDPLRATTGSIGAMDVTVESTDGDLYELFLAPPLRSATIDLAGDEPVIHWD